MTIDPVDPRRNKIEAQVRTIIQDICPGAPVADEADLVEDLGIDSVAMMTLILRVEGQFEVILGGKEMEAGVLKTARNLVDFLVSLSKQEQR